MSEKSAIITIAIPTYNRGNYLDLCLDRVFEEVYGLNVELRSSVVVLVSDNGSTDATEDIVARYRDKFGENFYSIRTCKNMGMDFNFARCYEFCETPYVWLLGDDDVLLLGGLKRVLKILVDSNGAIDILYVNNYWFRESYKEKKWRRRQFGTTEFNNAHDFARRTNVMLTYLSGLIVRSGIGKGYRSELFGTYLVQLSWVLPLLRDGKRFAIIHDWVIAAKGANSGGYKLVEVFGTGLQKISENILINRPELIKAIQNGAIVNFFPGSVIKFRQGLSRYEDRDMAVGLRGVFGKNWRYFFFLAPLVTLPLHIGRYYYFFIRIFIIFFGFLFI